MSNIFDPPAGDQARKNVFVDDTGLGPTLTLFVLRVLELVSHISEIFEFCRVIFIFLSEAREKQL